MLAVAAVCFCCALDSGQMWNHMRRPQFSLKTKDGPVYIRSGVRFQFVVESYIVAVMNGVVVLGMILMIEAAGGVQNPEIIPAQAQGKRRCFLSIVGLVLFFVFFSLLVSVFGSQRQGYPYCFRFK